jgi:excinuclease ABC subunit C
MILKSSVPFDPGAAAEFFAALPREPAVFALWPESGLAGNAQPYLSRTRNLRHRLERLLASPRPGLRRLNLNELTRRVDYQRVGSSFEASWLVYQLNRAYYPRAYRQRLRLKPPAMLKVNLRNRFPRCYPTRRLARDGSLYYGPFPSRAEAERFAGEFLDLFKIRRCVEDLNPDPSHPGCIYSQMRMCLAPCYAGCSDDEYQRELGRVVGFLDTGGNSLLGELESERGQASESLNFEEAGRIHHRLERVESVLRKRPGLVRNVADLNAVIVERGAEPNSVAFFRVSAGELRGPATLVLDQKIASPVPLDEQIRLLLESLAPVTQAPHRARGSYHEPDAHPALPLFAEPAGSETRSELLTAGPKASLPPWEHLSLLARWYYSSFREGEFVLLGRGQEVPHARLIRICRKLTNA